MGKSIFLILGIVAILVVSGCIFTNQVSQNETAESDCCTTEQLEAGFKCMKGCGQAVQEQGREYETSYSCLSPEVAESRQVNGCPICLSSQTKISTPEGEISVGELETGMLVWTVDNNGEKVAQPVVKVSSSLVPSSHEVVHIVLEDARELWVSPGHPTTIGRTIEELKAGDSYDGSIIINMIIEQYQGDRTYDLLPAGETGFYWANGILVDSTLK